MSVLKTIFLKAPAAIWSLFWRQREELSLFLQIQALLLLAGLALIKFAAVSHAFDGQSLAARLAILFQVCAYDFLLCGGVGILAFFTRLFRGPRPWLRATLLILTQTLFVAWLALSALNLEVYKSLGSPLSYNMLLLAPNTAPALVPSAVHEKAGALLLELAMLAALVLLGALIFRLLRPANPAPEQRGRLALRPELAPLAVVLAGIASFCMPATSVQASVLRNMSVLSLLALDRHELAELPPPSAQELKALSTLCGPDRLEGKAAFEKLPRKKRNVILFVWESVGARFLKSCHPLGTALTPNLDALLQRGGVYCSQCYAESPLSAQSAWSLVTGLSAPARPVIFTYGSTLPPYNTTLPAELKRAGFETAAFCASNTEIAAMSRIFETAGFSVFEDFRTLKNRDRYTLGEFGVDDTAIVERTMQWIDTLPKDKPFFTVLWTYETHYPYRWTGMPEALSNADPLKRFDACIEHSDAHLKDLYAGLVQRGLDKDTILIVVGDHGEGMGRPPRPYDRGHSMLVYEDTIHVPLYFITPELKQPARVEHACVLADIFPTVMSLEGLAQPPELEGRSLAESYPSHPLFARSIVWWPVAAKAGPYTLILNEPGGAPELYNLAADPAESQDLAEKEPDVANVLMRALIRFTCDRFKTDSSFDFGFKFLPSGTNRPARPQINDLLNKN